MYKQRLGAINLVCDDSQDIELFDWTTVTADAAESARTESRRFERLCSSHEQTVTGLNNQLQDLIQAKKQQEADLFNKFKQLLNSKKARIRQLMRALSEAEKDDNDGIGEQPFFSADFIKAQTLLEHAVRKPSSTMKKTKKVSMTAKRKAASNPPRDVAEDGSNSSRQSLSSGSDDDKAPNRLDTPERDDEDEEESGADESKSQLPSIRQPQKSEKTGGERMDEDVVDKSPPPRRQLPFTEKTDDGGKDDLGKNYNDNAGRSSPKPCSDHDESDETDDEL